jgi:predicted small lipoprotein YifL
MLAPVRGGSFVSPRRSTALFRLAVAMTLAAALAGCGRKGPLDLPPSAAAAPQPAQQATGNGLLTSPLGTGAPAQPQPGPPNRSFLLDPMLN